MRPLARRLLAGALLLAVACGAIAQVVDKGKLEIRLAETSRALPDEIDAMAAQLKELAPGLWESARTSRLFLAVAVGNRSDKPLPLSPFGMRLGTWHGADGVTFECTPERGQTSDTVLPTKQADYLCRAETPSSGSAVASLLAAVKTNPDLMDIQMREVRRPPPLPPRRAVLPAPAPVQEVRAEPRPRHSISDFETNLIASGKLKLLVLAMLAIAYYGCARAIGNRQAAVFSWILGTAYVGSIIAREGIGSGAAGLAMLVVVYPGMLLGAAALAAAFHWLFDLVTSDWETIKKRAYYALLGFISLALLTLLDL